MEDFLKKLTEKVLKKPYLWIVHRNIFLIIFVILACYIFVIPVLESAREFTAKTILPNTPQDLLLIFTLLQKSLKPSDYIYSVILFLLFLSFLYLYLQQQKSFIIHDNFNDPDLKLWSIPANAGWTTEECESANGQMLSVTNSKYPGILKAAYNWYDYEISFFAKPDLSTSYENQKISVCIRAESSYKAIIFELSKTSLQPYFLYNGTFIKEKILELPTTLKMNDWVDIKISVKGNTVDFLINKYKIQYKIPTKVYDTVDNIYLKEYAEPSITEIEQSNTEVESKQKEVVKIATRAEKLESLAEKDAAWKEIDNKIKAIPESSKVILDYQKGSVGFRVLDKEHVYYRNLTVRKI